MIYDILRQVLATSLPRLNTAISRFFVVRLVKDLWLEAASGECMETLQLSDIPDYHRDHFEPVGRNSSIDNLPVT
jgi:hypothetical protein